MFLHLKKVLRYFYIYSILRVIAKILGRLRYSFKFWVILKFPFYNFSGRKLGFIGCGHQAFSSLAYFVYRYTASDIRYVYDIDELAATSFANAYCLQSHRVDSLDSVDLVYISTNHASHTPYALECLKENVDVFIEKPICTSLLQLQQLNNAVAISKSRIFTGFNRPHAPAIRFIKDTCGRTNNPISLSCSVIAHFLPPDHWYRDVAEGTRVLSNISHWIDLTVHFLFKCKTNLPKNITVNISYSDFTCPTDNVSITLTSSDGDLFSIFFTSRSEPFEGVSESIVFQQDDVIAKVDDFRKMQLWKGHKKFNRRYWPKNNGHQECVLQPFVIGSSYREWDEIRMSAVITLEIDSMAKNHQSTSIIDLRN